MVAATLTLLLAGAALPREGLRVSVEQAAEGKGEGVVLYGDGTAFWNDKSYVRLPLADVDRVRAAVEASGFKEMPAVFGAGRKRLARRVAVAAPGFEKAVVQLQTGDQSEALAGLAASVLDVVRTRLGEAISTRDLAGAAQLLSRRELPLQALALSYLRKPAAPSQEPGFLLKIRDGRASVQPVHGDRFGKAAEVPLPVEVPGQVASALVERDFARLPQNLYATGYAEVVVTVLGHRKAVLARQFAGMGPDEQSDARARFEAITALLDGLVKRGIAPRSP
jgi:hypothetical protein